MDAPDDRVAWARSQFDPGDTYLDTATAGLPARQSWLAARDALDEWRLGRADAAAYDVPVQRARSLFAGLVGVSPAQVAVGSQTSALVGVIASSLPEGCEVLTTEGDFTSVLFPFLARRHLRVREVPLERLVESVTRSTYLVAVSAIQSRDGRVVDLGGLEQACASTGTKVLLDTTQAVGWLPVDASRYAYTVTAGYKWLLSARGTAFLTIAPDLMDDVLPTSAGWYAGSEPWASIYGSPLRLAETARRFDVSPVWHSWVGQAPALELLTKVGRHTLQTNALNLAKRFCDGVGAPFGQSAIVSLAVDDDTLYRLRDAGVTGSMRAGRLRLSFHISTTEDDVDRAVEALTGHVRPGVQ